MNALVGCEKNPLPPNENSGVPTGKQKQWRKFQKAHRPGVRCQGHAIGNYIVDFCSIKAKLIIELDGSQHLKQEKVQS